MREQLQILQETRAPFCLTMTYAQVRFKLLRALIHHTLVVILSFFPFIYRIVGKIDNIPNIGK